MVEALTTRPSTWTVLVAVVLLVGACILYWGVFLPEPDEYDRTTVTVTDETDAVLATADVRIADSMYEQYIGLSRTESLAEDEGMLFVHDSEDTRSYAMRGMDISIDIIFIDSDGQITTIHSAEQAESIVDRVFYDTYPGRGQWVLEMPHGWAAEHGISEGDTVRDLPR